MTSTYDSWLEGQQKAVSERADAVRSLEGGFCYRCDKKIDGPSYELRVTWRNGEVEAFGPVHRECLELHLFGRMNPDEAS